MNRFFEALGRGVVRFRWLVVVAWVGVTVLAVATLPSLGSQVNNDNNQFLPANAPSNRALALAQPLVGSGSKSQIPVVVTANAGSIARDQGTVNATAQALEAAPTVQRVRVIGISPDQHAAQLLVTSSVSPFDQRGTRKLVDRLQSALGTVSFPTGVQAHLAGDVATNAVLQKQSDKTGNRVQGLSILLILVLLFVIFRSALAPFLTLLPPVLVLTLSQSLIGGLGAAGLKISSITQLLLIVLLLGAGTDYGLFLVFRVREELWQGRTPHEAVAHSVARVGESITASAATVVVALLSLLFASFGVYHDLGIPLAIGVAVMLLAGVTLLPALLAIFGRAVFWPSAVTPREHRDGLWGRVAARLVNRPALALGIGVLAFGALAVGATGYKAGGFGGNQVAPAGTGVAIGNAALARHFPQSSQNPTTVVMRFATPVWDDPAVLAQASARLRASGQFTTLAGPLNPTGANISPAELQQVHRALLPAAATTLPVIEPLADQATVSPALYQIYRATARSISADGHIVAWETGLTAGDAGSTHALQAVPRIRAAVTSVARQVGAAESGVAGQAPGLADVSSTSASDLRHIVPLAVLAIGLVLALVLRSAVAPLYLILSVVLSYLASLGLAVLVFEKLGGSQGITFVLPFLMFLFLLALGEDYNILVMTRIREEAHRFSMRQAVIRAIGTTGPTVTSAGLVLAGSFAVLALGGGSGSQGAQVRAIGFGLAVGILLDTFVVRTVLVPSTVALLGRWNWWPAAMGRHAATPAAEVTERVKEPA